MEKLEKVGVMAGASLNMDEVLRGPRLREREFFVKTSNPEMSHPYVAWLPWRLSDSSRGNYRDAPLLGESNDYVFGELLHLPNEETLLLEEEGVIY